MPAGNQAYMTSAERPHPPTSGECTAITGGAFAASRRLSLASRTALELPIGEIVATFLAAALGLAEDVRMRIACVVHEAVLNAVLHGNLAMAHEGQHASSGIDDLRAAIEARLADPALADRRCEIRVRWRAAAILVRVTDHGAGFRVALVPDEAVMPWGRGIRVMRALATRCRWVRGGRSLLLRFAR
jgi:anti-sigma regulatory factor (Ser/Thr protein kinase)